MTPGATPIVKVRIERADVSELVWQDPLLRGAALLKALGEAAGGMLKASVGLRFPDGVLLFQQGEVGDTLFFVIGGEVRLCARSGSEVVELGNVPRGEVVGQAEVLAGGGPREVTAVAQGRVDAVEVPRAALLGADGELLGALREYLAEVQHKRQSTLEEMSDFLKRW